jgi:hypothetical protein
MTTGVLESCERQTAEIESAKGELAKREKFVKAGFAMDVSQGECAT